MTDQKAIPDGESVLKIGSGKSTHPCYYMRLFEGTGIMPNMADVRNDFRNSAQSAEKNLDAGDLDKAAFDIAMTVMVDKRSEEVLNKYKQRISPDLYTCVVKKMSSFRIFAPPSGSSDFGAPASEISKYRQMREKDKLIFHAIVDNDTADAEYSSHSSALRQIFARCGIEIPASLKFDCLIIAIIEGEIQGMVKCISSNSSGDARRDKVELLFNLFQKALPKNYFILVRKKVPMIREGLNLYVVSAAIHRQQAKTKSEVDTRRNLFEKIYDTLPPEHFAFCLENLPSFKDSLEEYIKDELSATKATKPAETQAAKHVPSNSQSKKKDMKRRKIEMPDSIRGAVWHKFYDFGNQAADFVLDAFAMFEMGDFASWDPDRLKKMESAMNKVSEDEIDDRNDVCLYILIERMKEKEFFCCHLCEETLFNWKQAMIHFVCNLHIKNEKAAVDASIIEGFRGVMDSFTDIPVQLGFKYFMQHLGRYTENRNVRINDDIPSDDFIDYFFDKYWSLFAIEEQSLTGKQRSEMKANKLVFGAETLIERVKSELGREAMAELHEHLGTGKTKCDVCVCDTGSREGFYLHLVNTIHVHNSNDKMRNLKSEPFMPYCLLTLLVNVHRKDIINDPGEPGYEASKPAAPVPEMKLKTQEELEAEFANVPKPEPKTVQKPEIAKPDSISADVWQRFYKLGSDVADFVLDAFAVYSTTEFGHWDSNRVKAIESALGQVKKEARKNRDLVCEYILVQRLKEKELFWCSLCAEVCYNYKHALLHFMSEEHREMETGTHATRPCALGFQQVVDSFTKLPKTWLENDGRIEKARNMKNGAICPAHLDDYRPTPNFIGTFDEKFGDISKGLGNSAVDQRKLDAMVERIKTETGCIAFDHLHKHLTQAQTVCLACKFITGDRDGFYAHHLSTVHLKRVSEFAKTLGFTYVCIFNALINVHKKDLI